MSDFGKEFFENFQVIQAKDSYLREQVYKLRYEVLCLEMGLESFPDKNYPDGLERDLYDDRSEHYLIRHIASDSYVGTVRLILSDDSDDLMSFPLIKNAHDSIDMSLIDHKIRASQVAEISRLIITKEFRTRIKQQVCNSGIYKDCQRIANINHLVAHPMIGLMAAILKMSSDHGVKYWFAGMEPSLNKRLSLLGLQLKPIGPLVEYHGYRRPYMGVVDDVVRSLYLHNIETWGFVTEQGKLWSPPKIALKQAGDAG